VPLSYPVGISAGIKDIPIVAGLRLAEPILMQFVLETIRAAKLMHAAGVIHRDIKPKNIMISSAGSPVIIDFGFAHAAKKTNGKKQNNNDNNICVIQPGTIKGELRYVLAEDVAKYQGCQRGDAYAMGKTLYEFIFYPSIKGLLSEPSGRLKIEKDEVLKENSYFRNMLFADSGVGKVSRFVLSRDSVDCLILMMRGLCRQENPISFEHAEKNLLGYMV